MENISKQLLSLVLLLSFIAIVGSCSKENAPTTSKVTFSFKNLPQKNISKINSINAINDLTTTTNVSEITCFAIIARYPEMLMINYCDIANGTKVGADQLAGMMPFNNGGSLEMDVKIGQGRTFSVVGWETTNGCHDVHQDFSPYESGMSEPFLLGQASADVGYAPMTVGISVNSAINATTQEFGECYGSLFDAGDTNFPGCNPAVISAYGDITSDWVNCNFDNNALTILPFSLATMSVNDSFGFRTTDGDNVRLNVTAISATTISFDYETYPTNSETPRYASSSVSLDTAANAYVELDTSTPSGVSTDPSDGTIDLSVMSLGGTGYLQASTGLGGRPGNSLNVTNNPNGDAVYLRFLTAPYTSGDSYAWQPLEAGAKLLP